MPMVPLTAVLPNSQVFLPEPVYSGTNVSRLPFILLPSWSTLMIEEQDSLKRWCTCTPHYVVSHLGHHIRSLKSCTVAVGFGTF